MSESLLVWNSLIAGFAPLFTAPTFRLFGEMMSGWVLCPGRHTVTRIYQIAEPEFKRSHDQYHRFFPDAAWVLAELWRQVAVTAVTLFQPTGHIPVDIDDTVFHKTGPKVDGAGWWRDAVRSTKTKVIHCFGLNLLILTFRITPRGEENRLAYLSICACTGRRRKAYWSWRWKCWKRPPRGFLAASFL
jgi:hypothetical protein